MEGKTVRAAAAYGAVGAMLLGWLLWLPDWRDWQPADALYIREARRLGAAVAAATFPGWQPQRQPLLVTKGRVNYLVGFPAAVPGAPTGRPVPADGLAVLRLDRPEVPLIAAGAFTLAGRPVAIIPGKSALDQTLSAFAEGVGSAGDGSDLVRGLLKVGGGVRLTPEQFVTLILHESLHAWQAPVLDGWMDRLDRHGVDDTELWRTVYGDADNNRLQNREVELLVAAFTAPTAEAALAPAQGFLAVRAQRAGRWAARLGPARAGALLDWEAAYEWSEGLARYIEIRAWETAADPAYRPLSELAAEPGYTGYAPGPGTGRQALIDQLAGPVDPAAPRERIYRLGAAQALVLDRLQPGWRAGAAAGTSLTELLSRAAGP